MCTMKRIRLMQITHDLNIGGLQQVVVNICRTIDMDRYKVTVLCLKELGDLTVEIEKLGIKVILLPQRESGTDYLSFLKVAKILKKEKIQVIHTHNTQPFFDGTLAAILSEVKSLIHTDHARHFPDKFRYMIAEWLVSHYAYRIVGVSDHTVENLHKYEKINKLKTVVIQNGVDERAFEIEVDKDEVKKSLGIPQYSFVVGVGVRLAKQKGIHQLIYAMSEVVKEIPQAVLVIAGTGEEQENLQQLAIELKLQNCVIFIGARTDIPVVLKAFDVYALPSYWEGLPMVILESMASGCPIIATDVGGVSNAITNGVNGILIKPRSPVEIKDAIIDLYKNETKRQLFVENGREIFRKNFSARGMTQRYEELYIESMHPPKDQP